MYRVSAQVMEEEEAFGIVTGYSLGQVASQTPANIMAEQAGIDLSIYHPLIAMDKTEIVDLARKIGTYQATEDAGGCLAAPKKPMTRARVEDVLAAEAELGVEEMAQDLGMSAGVYESYRCGCDIDEPSDLVEVLLHGQGKTPELLRELGFDLNGAAKNRAACLRSIR